MKKIVSMLMLSGMLLAGCGSQNNPPEQESATGQDSTAVMQGSSADSGKETQNEEEFDQHIAEVEKETGLHVVDNPESLQVYVNKQRKLPDGYEPPDLVVPDVRHRYEPGHMETHMRKEAAAALENLFIAAKEAGNDLMTISGYRSFDRQTVIYNNQVQANGKEYADKYSAYPGTSEHQTGLTMDVRYADDSKESKLDESFGDTETGKWLADHAHEYGFIIRYPKGKEAITGYSYEPWHIRYVGTEIANEIYTNQSTLEEYFGYDY